MRQADDGEQDRVGHGVLQAEEGEDEHGDEHREDLGPVLADEAVVDEEHCQVNHEVAQDRPHEEVPDSRGRRQVVELSGH